MRPEKRLKYRCRPLPTTREKQAGKAQAHAHTEVSENMRTREHAMRGDLSFRAAYVSIVALCGITKTPSSFFPFFSTDSPLWLRTCFTLEWKRKCRLRCLMLDRLWLSSCIYRTTRNDKRRSLKWKVAWKMVTRSFLHLPHALSFLYFKMHSRCLSFDYQCFSIGFTWSVSGVLAFFPRLAPAGCSCLGDIITDGVITEGNGNEFKASLENQHLRNGDSFVIIASSLHHWLLTEHAENGLL